MVELGGFEPAEAEAEPPVEVIFSVAASLIESAREADGLRVAAFGDALIEPTIKKGGRSPLSCTFC